jgi:hypothetical protein
MTGRELIWGTILFSSWLYQPIIYAEHSVSAATMFDSYSLTYLTHICSVQPVT